MEDTKQQAFPWAVSGVRREVIEVALAPETTAAVIALLTRALLAVVRTIAEADHER
ncbi:MAG: hypothetical protein IT294_17180 [Deltaproteobacteria bacterium]|nr:hypothetical protein [Deltaproteobacteria bacterium]